MFKITSLSTDKKYTLSLEITMRGHYSKSVKSESQLIKVLTSAIKSEKNNLVAEKLQAKLNNNEILSLCEFYGIIANSKVINYTSCTKK